MNMEFHRIGATQPATGDIMPFTLSPDFVFPPNRSLPRSCASDSPQASGSRSLTRSDQDEIDQHDACRAFSIEFYFPPADSEANSEAFSDSASYSSALGKESLRSDRTDEVVVVVGEHNKPPLLRFQGTSTERKHVVQNTQITSFGERALAVGLQKAAEVLDTLGSSISNLNHGRSFFSSSTLKGNKASVLAFEVASTIAKGATLLQSLSEENLNFFEMEILYSVGVRALVSNDVEELLSIYASEKREELHVLSREVIRFGNLCKDPQWHNLAFYFSSFESSYSDHNQLRDEAELTMHELVILAQHTLELYHKCEALDKLVQEYEQKLHEVEALNLPRSGALKILQSEIKAQRKQLTSLKRKSFWSRDLEEITEKLVNVVTYIHQAIEDVFGNNGLRGICKNHTESSESLGNNGLALCYANVILQIDSIVSDPFLPNARDSLYNALPAGFKTSLRFRLRSLATVEENLSASEVKAEMDKTLKWLVPFATNTINAVQDFGRVGERASTRIEFGKGKAAINNSLSRFQTLCHAKKHKMDYYIQELVIWLHRLIRSVRKRDGSMKLLPWQSQTSTGLDNQANPKTQVSLSPNSDSNTDKTRNVEALSAPNRLLLEKQIVRSKSSPGISKSPESVSLNKKKGKKFWDLSRSLGSSSAERDLIGRVVSEHQNTNISNILDVMDGLDVA